MDFPVSATLAAIGETETSKNYNKSESKRDFDPIRNNLWFLEFFKLFLLYKIGTTYLYLSVC
jgi:hypothetical protein